MDGNWKLVSVTGREETNQQSGNRFAFEEEAQKRLLFGSLETARHGERGGTLTLTLNGRRLFHGEGRLTQTDHDPRRKKQGKTKVSRSVFAFVPAQRLDTKEFAGLYGHIGTTMSAEFVAKAEEPENHSPKADDDNVVPGSDAEAMKVNVRRKATLVGGAA